MDAATHAQLLLPSQDLSADMAFFAELGFRLDQIYPADDPAVAHLSGHGLQLRLDTSAHIPPATLHLCTDAPVAFGDAPFPRTAPNGTEVHLRPATTPLEQPPTRHKFEVRQLRDQDPWVIGRAGMHYRDLIPDRLGGSIIASHIRIPEGGPVPDMVHYHTIGFQLIFCYRGWVKLVYEDQGPPFVLHAGECVTQPPEIRHQVLEASDMLEVIEIGVPAVHLTTIDHALELPTPEVRPDREWQGQRFCRHQRKDFVWAPWSQAGYVCRDTAVAAASKGVASVQVIRREGTAGASRPMQHEADIFFSFVLQGQMCLTASGEAPQQLHAGDAFVLPPGLAYEMTDASSDLELLQVTLPG